MPLINDKHGYHFGRTHGSDLPARCFEHAGKVWEITESTTPGKENMKSCIGSGNTAQEANGTK